MNRSATLAIRRRDRLVVFFEQIDEHQAQLFKQDFEASDLVLGRRCHGGIDEATDLGSKLDIAEQLASLERAVVVEGVGYAQGETKLTQGESRDRGLGPRT